MDEPLRVAIIGFGLGGAVFHAPLIAATTGLSVAAVVTGNAARQAQVRETFPHARVIGTVDDLWGEPSSIDLVVVTSPNRTHVPYALAAIAARLPVVIDKPVAATAADARRLRDAAAAGGVPVTVFQNRRWDGDLLTVQSLIADGTLGEVRRFESRFERWRPTAAVAGWKGSDDPADAAGILLDLGSHLVDQALHLFGPVTNVYAELDRRRPGANVDDDAFVALTHESGVRSHLWMSAVASDLGPRMRVLGSSAAYTTFGMDVQEAALRAGGRPDRDPAWGAVPEARWGRVGTPGDTVPVPTIPGAYQDFYAQVEAAVRTGGPLPVTLDEAVATADVLDAARSSAGKSLDVGIPRLGT